MTCILLSDVRAKLPPTWYASANKAKKYIISVSQKAADEAKRAGKSEAEIEALVREAVHQAINKKASVWVDAKDALANASNLKCWYCESRQDRSDNAVDHFRPKNAVIDAPDHPGYYWMAFSLDNLRYSCTYCNSVRTSSSGTTKGGKGAAFPILEPPTRQSAEHDPVDKPVLLDPLNPEDVELLTFKEDGFPHPAKRDALSKKRVKVSINLYHLDDWSLVRKRFTLNNDIVTLVSEAEHYRLKGNMDAFKEKVTKLISLSRSNAEFSSAARIYLSAHRKHRWVKSILARHV